MKGASIEAQKYATNIKEGTGSAQTFATNQRTIQSSMSETSIVSKVAAAGLSIFKAALNSLIFFAVIEGIQLLIKGIDNLILTADEAEEKAESLRGNMQSFFDEVQSGQQTISSVSDRFAELSEHVTKTGENIDLTKDEYSEYLDICNQVKTIMPELVTGYTNEGNAIITLKDNVDSLTESYKENIRTKAAAFITNGDDGNTIQSFFDDYKIFTEGENGLFAPSVGGLWNNKSTDYEDYYGYDKVYKWLEEAANASLEELTSLRGGTLQGAYLQSILNDSNFKGSISDITEENYEQIHDILDTRLTSLEGEMTTRVSNIKMSLQQMLYADGDYWDIDDKEALSAIDSMFSSIDAEFIKQNNLLGQDALQSFESNVVKLFEDKDTQKSMIDIYTPQGDDESIEDYSKRVNDAIEEVQNYAKDKKIDVPLDFTDATDNIEDLQQSYEDTINRFKSSEESNLDELTQKYDEVIAKRKELYSGTNYVGNVDINNRPVVINDDGSYSTTSTSFQEKWVGDEENGHYIIAHFTPILPDGTVLDEDSLNEYIDKILNSDDPMEADKVENGGKGIVYKVDTEINGKEIKDDNLEDAFGIADAWDVDMHNLQDKMYQDEAKIKGQIVQFGNDVDGSQKIKDFFDTEGINTDEEINEFNEVTKGINDADLAIQKWNEHKKEANGTPVSFENLFNNNSLDSTKKKLLDLSTSGELSAETITSTKDYKALLDKLGISADEFINKISEFNIQYNEDNYNSLIDLLSRVRKGEILSADEATTLIATYDSLAGELVKTGNGYSFNESAIISLSNKYAETSNLAISNEVKKTNAAIEGVKERINAYGIEIEALKTIQKIYEDTGSKIEVMNWLKDNGYSMFMASNYLDIANEYSKLEKKSESLKSKMLEQIETSSVAGTSALDRIANKYKELTDVIGSNVNLILSQIKLLEAQGKEVGEAYYTELVDQSSTKIAVLTEQFNELRQQFLNTSKGTDEWLELNSAILEVQNSIIEAKTSMAEYQKTLDNMKWERAKNKFDSLSDIISSNTDLLKAQMDLLEKQGSKVGKGFYTEMISESQKQLELLNNRYQTLMQQILTVDEGSDDWLDLNKSIFEVQKSITEARTNIEDFQNSIDQLHWDTVDEIADAINGISDEAGNILDLLDTDDVLDDNNKFTKDAITALAMYGEQLESAQYLVNKYSKEIEYLNVEYIKGTITVEEYNSKMQELNEAQWESVDAYNSAKKAIIELRKKGIDKEIDALEELYDARKKAWKQEQDQHDWEKKVAEHDKSANKLKNQIAELMNDNSLSGIKKRKELEDELKDLESDWEDTLYDHVYDERQDQLDKELEDKKKTLEKTLKDEEKLVADSVDLVNKNCSTVLNNLSELSKKYGVEISSSITEGFKSGENALSSYSGKFSEAHSGFTTQLDNTEQKVYAVQAQADNTALSILAMFNLTNGTLDEQLATTDNKINNLHIDADSAATSIVNMFKSTNGTLGEQLSKTREAIQAIIDKTNEANNALKNMGIRNSTGSTTSVTPTAPTGHESDGGLGSIAHDTSGTTLPNAGTWKNADQDITNSMSNTNAPYNDNEAKAAETAKKAVEEIVKAEEKKKNQSSSKLTIGGSSKSNFTTISKGYASGTQSATKGLHPMFEEGVEVIEKDGNLIMPLSGGEKVFSNEQTQRLWELSQNPDMKEKFRQELLNINPYANFKFGSTVPVTKTNQNVNVQQHFDALVKVEGDMTPDVLAQLTNDRKVVQRVKDIAMEGNVEAYNTRGYRTR